LKIKIAYFSGTGCTELVANNLNREFLGRGHLSECFKVTNNPSIDNDIDLLVICFVVHACNAPEPVLNWAKSLKTVESTKVVIISVSGGGEVTPNLSCREPLKRILMKRGFNPFYETMIIMPSNWIVPTKHEVSKKLLEVLPSKLSYIVNDLESGKINLTKPLLGNRILTFLGKLEHLGAPYFGKKIKVDQNCNSCGICVSKCPVSNISIVEKYPTFANKCVLCLNCIYSCPQKSLKPGIMKFVVISQGFNLKQIIKSDSLDWDIDYNRDLKGLTWKGVKQYLLEDIN